MADGSGLENRRGYAPVGSNPTPSSISNVYFSKSHQGLKVAFSFLRELCPSNEGDVCHRHGRLKELASLFDWPFWNVEW